MTKITLATGCGNAQKKEFIQKINIVFAKARFKFSARKRYRRHNLEYYRW